jgi:hypothetical protein
VRTSTPFLAILLVAVALLAIACGGGSDSDDGGPPTSPPGASTSAAGTAPPSTPSGDECTVDEPPRLHSTTHEVDIPTTEQTIEMEWEAPADLVRSYRYAFSQNPQEPPDQMETLDGDTTSANSGPLGQNRWYFYLVEVLDGGEEPFVRCGPYVVTREGSPRAEGGGGGGGDTVTLSISVAGGSSVEYFTNQGERLFCGDTTLSLHEVTCSADFSRGSEARIQRTLSLTDEEEARWRLAGWGGACDGIDATTEPRGGQCILVMDEDKEVDASFAQRAMLTISHTGPSQLLMRWGLAYEPAAQLGGGNPLTLRGQFDCDTDMLAECGKSAFYDVGTKIVLTAGTGVDNGNLASFSGGCVTTASTCQFELQGDTIVTFNWKY